jgi:hypothetical protein
MERIEVNLQTGETSVIALTAEELAQAEAANAAWQITETVRLAQKALDDAKQAKFEEWLATQENA